MPLAKSRPLSADVRDRLMKFHRSAGGEASWQEIADAIKGITGAAIRNYVVNGGNVQNPQTAERIVRVLEQHENERDGVAQTPRAAGKDVGASKTLIGELSLEHLIQLIAAKGFKVSITRAGEEF